MPQTRQLAAIMFTDIVGYTALMGTDEKKAFSILTENRKLQRPLIEQFNGNWIKEMGDGILASFSSVSDAVTAAIQIQETCKARQNFQLRIGIHLGEVVFDDGDVFGDGVNIASRIQAIAPPGGIYVSEPVYQNISNKKELTTNFVSEANLKNVKETVCLYEVLTGHQTVANEFSAAIPKTNEHSQKSIAVLPFVNMSNDAEQEFFCDGVAEEIMNALAQLDHLRVIARTSAFAFKGKNLDARQIGKTLEVDTLLEGSVRKAGNRLRITTKLVQVADGSQLWSKRYDRELEDVFAIQENIAENVATALQGVLTNKEKESIRRPETTNIEAYEYYLRGRRLFHQIALKDAGGYFEKAIALDPQYALAYTGLADTHSWLYEWEGAHPADLEAAERNSQTALALAPYLSESYSARGFVLSLGKRFDEAELAFKEAISLNANNFDAYYYLGRSCFARGQIRESANWFRIAADVRREDFQSPLLLAQSLRILGDDPEPAIREGINRARKQLQLYPADRRALSLTAGNLWDIGERDEAIQWINKALDLYPDDTGVLVNAACFFAKAGQNEKALDLLENVFGKGFGKRDWIEHDPDYDSLRDEPRFQALLGKLK